MSLSRPTASKFTKKISLAVAASFAVLGLSAAPSMAHGTDVKAPIVKEATAAVNAVLAVCPGQTFAQPFEALGDANYYTLVEGSEFNSPSEGWELFGGAHVLNTTRPDGSTGAERKKPRTRCAINASTEDSS